jgi:two-component system LytT family response regulator
MNIRVLVIDDEPISRLSIVRMLREDDDIELVGEYGDGASVLEAIRQRAPDLIFVDIQMPEMTGIDLVAAIDPERLPVTVFVTAYEQYAVKAFEANAVDYLVKPFSRERFLVTLARAKRRLAATGAVLEKSSSAQVLRALEALRKEQNYLARIPVCVDEHIVLVDVEEIDWFEANRNTVRVHTGKYIHELRETMTNLEARLHPRQFVRVHRSAIVNVKRIKAIHPWFHGYHVLVLDTGQELRMSRYQHESFLKLMGRQPADRAEDMRAARCHRYSERHVERHFALHADLIRGDAALEEVGDFLHILQIHEVERILRTVFLRHVELGEALVGAVFEVLAHVLHRQADHAAGKHVLGEQGFAGDRVFHHLLDLRAHGVVKQLGLLLAHRAHDIEGEGHVAALVAEHPVGARGEAMQQAARTQVIDVGERGIEEQAFDAGGEADQVEQELLALFARLQSLQVLDRVDPLEAELALGADRGDVLDRRKRLVALGRVRNVGVEQGEVELHMQRLLVKLARQIHARFGRVDVLVQVQHQVVRHDGVAGGEERHQAMDQVTIGGGHLRREVVRVHREIHFLDRPGVLDRVAVHLVEAGVTHRAQSELEAGIENVRVADGLGGHEVPSMRE